MGRYYSGDIEGKFWFGSQASNDADFFGVEGTEPNYLEYYFDEENIESIKSGIAGCRKVLGKNEKKLHDFFKSNEGYNDEMLIKAGFKESEIDNLIEWYARLRLGEEILECVQKTGKCQFDAEL